MTDTEALRRALDRPMTFQADQIIYDAARRWLALAEGDEGLRWRMTRVLLERFDYPSSTVYADAVDAVLAAITEEGE